MPYYSKSLYRKRSEVIRINPGGTFRNEMKQDVGAFGWYAADEDGTKCAVKIVIFRTNPMRVQINVIYCHSGFYYNGTLESN